MEQPHTPVELYAVSDLRLDQPSSDGHPHLLLACWETLIAGNALVLVPGGLVSGAACEPHLGALNALPGAYKLLLASEPVVRAAASYPTVLAVNGRAQRVDVHGSPAGAVICGARGSGPNAEQELQMALKSAHGLRRPHDALCVLVDQPPFTQAQPGPLNAMIEAAGTDVCVYSSLQAGCEQFEGNRNGTLYRCVSSPHLRMRPLRLGRFTAAGFQVTG